MRSLVTEVSTLSIALNLCILVYAETKLFLALREALLRIFQAFIFVDPLRLSVSVGLIDDVIRHGRNRDKWLYQRNCIIIVNIFIKIQIWNSRHYLKHVSIDSP